MRKTFIVATTCLFVLVGFLAASGASAGECDGSGTNRTIVVDPTQQIRIGTMNYPETLPLLDKEVVLTFDDGPLHPYTGRILDILARECVHATFFIVGQMAKIHPELIRREYAEGHTIGTHTMNHPLRFRALTAERSQQEIDQGIAAVTDALGDPDKVAPFFRFPGFARTEAAEEYLASRHIMVWSADFPADDWKRIGVNGVVHRALSRIEAKGKGILLLHDIHERTVEALPIILKELKTRGYHFVHVVPASPNRDPPEMAVDTLAPSRPQPAVPETVAHDQKDAADADQAAASVLRGRASDSAPDRKVGTVKEQNLGRNQNNAPVTRTTRVDGETTTASRYVVLWVHWIYSALQNTFAELFTSVGRHT